MLVYRLFIKTGVSFTRSGCVNRFLRPLRPFSTTDASVTPRYSSAHHLIDYHGAWPDKEKNVFASDMVLIENFFTSAEEESFLIEIEPYLKRLRYEFDHWDDAIHGFRETERKHWYPDNKNVIERVKELAFGKAVQPYIHVLDLAKDGVIKPHVDSVRYCGSTIAGLSLLSDCVMRLVRVDEEKYKQSNDEFRAKPESGDKAKSGLGFFADILLPRYSLYIMKDTARYNFTHEILDNKVSEIFGKTVPKGRRISIICRNEPS